MSRKICELCETIFAAVKQGKCAIGKFRFPKYHISQRALAQILTRHTENRSEPVGSAMRLSSFPRQTPPEAEVVGETFFARNFHSLLCEDRVEYEYRDADYEYETAVEF